MSKAKNLDVQEDEFSDLNQLEENSENNGNEELDDLYQPQDQNFSNMDTVEDNLNMKDILAPSKIIRRLELLWRGFIEKNGNWVQTPNSIARDDFINTAISGLRSIVNETFLAAYKFEEEIEFILREKNREFIFLMYDEPTIDEDKIESIANQYDHALELFLSFSLKGHGSELLKQINAKIAKEDERNNKKSGWGIEVNGQPLFGGGNKT